MTAPPRGRAARPWLIASITLALAALLVLPGTAAAHASLALGMVPPDDGGSALLAPSEVAVPPVPPTPGSAEPSWTPTGRTSMHLTATYDVRATLKWGSGRLTVRSEMHVRNTSGGPIERLELNAIPARIGDMVLDGARVDGSPVNARIKGQTIHVPLDGALGGPLTAGQSVDVVVTYRAWFASGLGGHLFLFSKANSIRSAYRWIPWVSRATQYETSWHGDPFVTVNSPHVRVDLGGDVPLRFATSGRLVRSYAGRRVFVADDVRDFNFTAARDYHRKTGQSFDGQTKITVFTRSLSGSTILTWAKRSIAEYEDRIGPYPYPTLTFGESSGGIGMESPAHIWLPYGYGNSRLPFLISHEVAHQWFYAAVGNDQTTNPFADEGLAEFLNRQWMGYRGSECSKTRLDRSMYAYSSGCYYEIIYVQGTNFLRELKEDMGSTRFWAALRDYYQTYKWKLASNKKLLETLRDHAQNGGSWLLPRYRARFPSLY